MTACHPATFSRELYPVLRAELVGATRVLDPFCGMGTFLDLIPDTAVGVGVEIEAEWAALRPEIVHGNSLDLVAMFGSGSFSHVVSSPVYPNGMTDNFDAGSKSGRAWRRHTYRQALGRPLTAGSMSGCGRGLTKRHNDGHEAIAAEIVKVLAPRGRLVWNCKDVIVAGELVAVVDWWADVWTGLGLKAVREHVVACPGQRYGANRDARADTESVLVFRKGAR